MAYLTQTTTTSGAFGTRLAAAFEAVATYFKERKLYRETFNSLSALTDRELADLGLTRSELHNVALTSVRMGQR